MRMTLLSFLSGSTLAGVISCAEDALRQVQSWANDNDLVINPSKCSVMIISPQVKNVTPISISQRLGRRALCIKTVSELRLLGITFTSNLKWLVHATNTRKSICKMICAVNRLGNTTNTNTRLRIFQAFVQPKLTSCLPLRGHLTSCTAMDHTLVHAAKVVLRNRAGELSKPTLLSSGLLPFNELCIQRCILVIHAIISNDNTDDALYVPPFLAQTNTQTFTRNVIG